MRRNRKFGPTLPELVLLVPLVLLAVAAVGVVYGSGSRILSSVSDREDLGKRAIRSVDRLALELSGATPQSLGVVPAAPYWVDAVCMERLDAVGADGRLDWNTIRISLEYEEGEIDDGKDNNGDGRADEGRVLLTTGVGSGDERSTVLCRTVREYLEGEVPNGRDDNGNGLVDERGLCFVLEDGLLRILLTLEDPGRGGREVRTARSALGLRE